VKKEAGLPMMTLRRKPFRRRAGGEYVNVRDFVAMIITTDNQEIGFQLTKPVTIADKSSVIRVALSSTAMVTLSFTAVDEAAAQLQRYGLAIKGF
jgi:ribosomal protein L14